MSQWDVARPAAPRRSGSGDLELGPGGGAKAEQRGGEGAGGGDEPSFLLPRRIQAPASPPPSLPRAVSPLLPPPPPPPRGFSGAARGLLPPPLPATAPRLRPVPTTTAPAVARASALSTRRAARRAEPATALPSVPTQLHPPAPARHAEPRKPSKTVASMCAAAAVVASTSQTTTVSSVWPWHSAGQGRVRAGGGRAEGEGGRMEREMTRGRGTRSKGILVFLPFPLTYPVKKCIF